MNTLKLSLSFTFTPQSLKDVVSLIGASPKEISKTSLVYLEKNLFFYYDTTGISRSRTRRLSQDNGVKVACMELAPGTKRSHIHYCLAMYSLATKCLNCQVYLALKGKRLTILITPLDENSATLLNSLVEKEPPADEF